MHYYFVDCASLIEKRAIRGDSMRKVLIRIYDGFCIVVAASISSPRRFPAHPSTCLDATNGASASCREGHPMHRPAPLTLSTNGRFEYAGGKAPTW